MIHHVWGLLARPAQEFKQIRQENESIAHVYSHHILLLALIPAISAFIGATQVGWITEDNTTIILSVPAALSSMLWFYLLMLLGVAVMGKTIHWMASRYGSHPSVSSCMVFAGYVATPIFICGIVGAYPMLWLGIVAGAMSLCYTAYLLYVGVPGFLGIERAESVMFSSAVLAFGILLLEIVLILSVLLWGYGLSQL